MNRITLSLFMLITSVAVFAQDYNPIVTATPFLTISPESRGSAMGDAGAATSPDANSQYWNASKYAFIEDEFGLSMSYTPWLRELVDDIGLMNLSAYYRFDDMQTISGSMRYFSLGEIVMTDAGGNAGGGKITPNEFLIDLAYARKFSDFWSGAVAFRYIRSDLYSGYSETSTKAANAFAADISAFHTKEVELGAYDGNYAFGVNLSNIGSKVSYRDGEEMFLPANLKIGGALTVEIDDYNKITGTVDLNKLMVPTPETGASDEFNDMSSLTGIFKSFGDAPGGFKEEMQEIMVSVGAEYLYDNSFAVRAGYFHENENKGNRKFFSFGAGFAMNVFALDVSYLVPVDNSSPLANTIRFSLVFGVDGIQNIFTPEG